MESPYLSQRLGVTGRLLLMDNPLLNNSTARLLSKGVHRGLHDCLSRRCGGVGGLPARVSKIMESLCSVVLLAVPGSSDWGRPAEWCKS
jgi:hypothetical protein